MKNTNDTATELHPFPQERQKPSITRRGIIFGAVGIASMFAVGGASVALAGEQNLLRPPGNNSEAHLVGTCIKCDRCRSACPQNVIDVAHIEDGFVNARTPKLSFRKGYCDFCKEYGAYKCVVSCPTGSLVAGFDPLSNKIGLAEIDTNECLLYRSGSCSKPCIEACEYDAVILYSEHHIGVDESLCNGCGACEYVCPSSSYGSYTGTGKRGINITTGKARLL